MGAMHRAESNRLLAWLRLALIPLLLATLAACAESFDANVTRFQVGSCPPPAGQSFAVVPGDPSLAGGLEFAQYARLVSAQLVKQGYSEAPSPEAATLIVHFSYGVDKGHEHIRNSASCRRPLLGAVVWLASGGLLGRRLWPRLGRRLEGRCALLSAWRLGLRLVRSLV